MIDFRRKELMPANLLAVTAILVLTGTFAFMIYGNFISPPTTKGLGARIRAEKQKAFVGTDIARKEAAAAKTEVDANVWTGSPDEISPTALARLTAIAKRNSVNLTAFRPQRETEAGTLVSLPFQVNLEGTYPNVVKMIREIDAPGTKLAVTLTQINSTNDASGEITATVGMVAYLKPKKTEAPPPPSRSPIRRSPSA
jgi:Tfp pilus assembly protein PilO